MKTRIVLKAFSIALFVTIITSIIFPIPEKSLVPFGIPTIAFWLTLGIAYEYLSKKDKSIKGTVTDNKSSNKKEFYEIELNYRTIAIILIIIVVCILIGLYLFRYIF